MLFVLVLLVDLTFRLRLDRSRSGLAYSIHRVKPVNLPVDHSTTIMADGAAADSVDHLLSPSSQPSSSFSSYSSAFSLAARAPAITASLSGVSGISASHLPPPPLSSPPTPSTMAGWIAWLFFFFFQVIPSLLHWFITFSTITLPTWLFTLFSMSLTFTMNFTTL